MTKYKDNETCIFINSCDKTHDVAEYFLKSFDSLSLIIITRFLLG